MAEWRQGYKVCHVTEHGGFVSATALTPPLDKNRYAIVNYGVGKISRPNKGCGPLAVFGKLSQAKEFELTTNSSIRPLVIFRCLYKPTKFTKLLLFIDLKNFYTSYPVEMCPLGTIAASAVKLTKQVM
jgi:hypothetical protein